MENNLENLFERNEDSDFQPILEYEDLNKLGGLTKYIVKILDYYCLNTNEYEHKYYMDIQPPLNLNGLIVPGPIVELHTMVRRILKVKEIKNEKQIVSDNLSVQSRM